MLGDRKGVVMLERLVRPLSAVRRNWALGPIAVMPAVCDLQRHKPETALPRSPIRVIEGIGDHPILGSLSRWRNVDAARQPDRRSLTPSGSQLRRLSPYGFLAAIFARALICASGIFLCKENFVCLLRNASRGICSVPELLLVAQQRLSDH